jgi:hypothetical protein
VALREFRRSYAARIVLILKGGDIAVVLFPSSRYLSLHFWRETIGPF